MKILILNTLYKPIQVGGAEKSVALLAESLVRFGDSVIVVTLVPGNAESVENVDGVKVYRLPIDNRYFPWASKMKPSPIEKALWHFTDDLNERAGTAVARVLDIECPDVLHTNNLSGFSVAIWRHAHKRGIRIVHTLRDYYLLCPRSSMFRKSENCTKPCAACQVLSLRRRYMTKYLDHVVSNSQYVLDVHRSAGLFADTPSSVIFNISPHVGKASLSPTAPDGDLIFGFIGMVIPEKGIEIVLRATQLLPPKGWKLRIAGTGSEDYMNRLRSRYGSERIEWLGFCNSAIFYRQIDVCLISSVWAEPLPRTLIECYTFGKSAICAESGGILEIAALGKKWLAYKGSDVEALAACMAECVKSPGDWRDGGFLNTEASTRFGEDNIVAQYREVYLGAAKEE